MAATAQQVDGPGLQISRQQDGDTIVIELHGELEMATMDRARAELGYALDSDCARIAVDLRGLHFLDSTGLNELAVAHQRCAARSRGFSLRLAPGHVQRVLEVSGMLRLIDHTTEEALAA